MLIVNIITQSNVFDYTQSVHRGAFVTLVIEHCLTALFDVSYHQHSLLLKINVRNEQLSQKVFKLEYVVSKYMHVLASCGHDGLSNPFTWLR